MKPVRFTLLLITLAVLLVLSATGSALSGAVRIPLEALPELLMPAAQPDPSAAQAMPAPSSPSGAAYCSTSACPALRWACWWEARWPWRER